MVKPKAVDENPFEGHSDHSRLHGRWAQCYERLVNTSPGGLGHQLVRYGLVGVLNTSVGLSVTLMLQSLAGFGIYHANAAGYAVGLLTSFLLNRSWTFGARDQPGFRLFLSILAFVIAYGANLMALTLLIGALGPVLAQVAAIAVYSMVFFVLCRHIVFAALR